MSPSPRVLSVFSPCPHVLPVFRCVFPMPLLMSPGSEGLPPKGLVAQKEAQTVQEKLSVGWGSGTVPPVLSRSGEMLQC